ncbi:MAG: hypothetical protein KDJ75_08565 [Alphaproteobacteria bacterium]|nr:hypothetical protein [Alphaproteobacteria bacterium]
MVWTCKYRRRILKPNMCAYLRKVLPGLARSMPGVTIGVFFAQGVPGAGKSVLG